MQRLSALCAMALLLAGCDQTTDVQQSPIDHAERTNQLVTQLTDHCYQQWQELEWTVGEDQSSAADNEAFSGGIQKVCQARVELFLEGYEITPIIEPNSQQHIYPLVFRVSVEEIKNHIRSHLPALRLI